jgi:hypothetical protein
MRIDNIRFEGRASFLSRATHLSPFLLENPDLPAESLFLIKVFGLFFGWCGEVGKLEISHACLLTWSAGGEGGGGGAVSEWTQ